MRIDLALKHFVLQILFLLFILQPCLQQQKDRFTQIVDAPADIADFVIPFNGRIPFKIPLLHTQHFGPDSGHGNIDHPVQGKYQEQAHSQNAYQCAAQDAPQKTLLAVQLHMGNILADIASRHFQGDGYHDIGYALPASDFIPPRFRYRGGGSQFPDGLVGRPYLRKPIAFIEIAVLPQGEVHMTVLRRGVTLKGMDEQLLRHFNQQIAAPAALRFIIDGTYDRQYVGAVFIKRILDKACGEIITLIRQQSVEKGQLWGFGGQIRSGGIGHVHDLEKVGIRNDGQTDHIAAGGIAVEFLRNPVIGGNGEHRTGIRSVCYVGSDVRIGLTKADHLINVRKAGIDAVGEQPQIHLRGIDQALPEIVLENIIAHIADDNAHPQQTGGGDYQYSLLYTAETAGIVHESASAPFCSASCGFEPWSYVSTLYHTLPIYNNSLSESPFRFPQRPSGELSGTPFHRFLFFLLHGLPES